MRQLQNAIDRAKILADDERICAANLPPEVLESTHPQSLTALTGDVDLETLTKHHILDVYHRHSSNKARTARALGIGRRTLYRLLDRYGVSDSDAEPVR